MKSFIIGDVHGCFAELEQLLEKLPKSNEDKLYFVGDLIDKGPDSVKVLKLVGNLKAKVVKGNHEVEFLDYVEFEERGHACFEQIKRDLGDDLQDYLDWMESWPYFYEEKDFIVVHAGLNPNKSPAKTDPEILMNIRTWNGNLDDIEDLNNPPWYKSYFGKKLVIFGHWSDQGLVQTANAIGIDTGCVKGRKLTAVELPSRKIYQVDASKNYV